jgi:magnesium transporter
VSRPRTHGRHPSARVPCASSRRSSCARRTGGSQQGAGPPARPPGEFGPPIDAFRADDTRGKHAACANHVLRVQLRQVGRLADRFSEVRDGLQGPGRIVAYTDQYACKWSGGALKPRLAGLRGDIHSLIEYEEQLSSKVQFVLDALVGLIGIAQNDVFKVLTIVSIVGIPPTLVAGSMA